MYTVREGLSDAVLQEMDETEFPGVEFGEPSIGWTAYDEHGLEVGYLAAELCPDGSLYLSRVAVSEDHRGHGLQKRLMAAMERWAARKGISVAVTYTMPWNAPSANSLIGRGWKVYWPEEAWAGDEVVYWFKKLSAAVPSNELH